MSTIFGHDTIKAEVIDLINKKNAQFGADFTEDNLEVTWLSYDALDRRQTMMTKDLSGRYFGLRDIRFFKRDYDLLFKGIDVKIQVGSGYNNRAVLKELSRAYGLPPFEDYDFAPGLLDMSIEVGDHEQLIEWPFADSSWGWTGTCRFKLRNMKTSLETLIPDGTLDRFHPEELKGVFYELVNGTLSGLDYPEYFDLGKIITVTDLEGLEYPDDIDLGVIIHTTDLEGLEYPPMTDISKFQTSDLQGLEYPPAYDLTKLNVFALAGLDYPSGTGAGQTSAYSTTYPLDFSDYQRAIRTYRLGDTITDVNLVNVIVSMIQSNWTKLQGETNKSNLFNSFLNATIQSIEQKRSIHGWTISVGVKLSSQRVLRGNAVLRYDIQSEY
ncbi:hypothetical protein CPT_Moabite_138 [Serratia phage Moabite]|uniref:Uncharacterized protein n=1 Tax=Serratia phage Moabite TaxID=2587814 RepID=A0A4Y5TP70_9CAUD|nr:hypothetical protein HWC48_gp278 [Serratia phage Moabite]QDB71168.1 hypothetical protein CPT_Moabite_138 [Serratia phage Moabite]